MKTEGGAQFYARTACAKKILVVDLGFLGDAIHLLPALWEVRRHYPNASLQVLTTPLGAEILRLAPCVNRAWIFPLSPQSPPWWRHWDILWALRRERFDLALNFGGADRSIFITALSGAKWKLAHQGGRRHFWNSWVIRHWVSRRDRTLPVYEQRRQVLAACGFQLDPVKFGLEMPQPAQQWACAEIPPGAIHLSINASTHLKEWPLEHWIRCARLLLERFPARHLIASAGRQERERRRLHQLDQAVGDPRLKILPPGLAIDRLAAALSRCSLHVGCDSGVIHLAMALDIPTLGIFRQYAGLSEWTPRGPNHRQISVPCPCADQKEPACQSLDHARCLAEIEPEQLLPFIEPLINNASL